MRLIFLGLWFESNWHFLILQVRIVLKIDCTETKFQPSVFNQKHKVGWLAGVDLVRVLSLHIINRNYPNMFLLIISIVVICK